jgi:hypothetical protein
MLPDNFNNLPLKTRFHHLLHDVMEKHGKQPCDLYHKTTHYYSYILKFLSTVVNHRFDTAETLMEKMGYRIIIRVEPISDTKKNNTSGQ